jgi:hypothetical protein
LVTRIDIINRALALIGEEPLQSETAPGADTHLALYDSILEDVLSKNPWLFARFFGALARLTEAPPARWKYAYQLPSDLLGPPMAVYDSKDTSRRPPLQLFELVEGRQLWADAAEVWIRGVRKPSPLYWPGYFRELVRLALAAELALAVREDGVLRTRLRAEAYGDASVPGSGGQFAVAAGLDSQGSPSVIIAEGRNPLLEARY